MLQPWLHFSDICENGLCRLERGCRISRHRAPQRFLSRRQRQEYLGLRSTGPARKLVLWPQVTSLCPSQDQGSQKLWSSLGWPNQSESPLSSLPSVAIRKLLRRMENRFDFLLGLQRCRSKPLSEHGSFKAALTICVATVTRLEWPPAASSLPDSDQATPEMKVDVLNLSLLGRDEVQYV